MHVKGDLPAGKREGQVVSLGFRPADYERFTLVFTKTANRIDYLLVSLLRGEVCNRQTHPETVPVPCRAAALQDRLPPWQRILLVQRDTHVDHALLNLDPLRLRPACFFDRD